MNNTRGSIRDREASNAVKDYTKLRWGKITPTDIDGLIDFGGKLFIVIELKYGDKELERGQELALERLADTIGKSKVCYAIVARYNTKGDIQVDTCIVERMRVNEKWIQSREGANVKCLIDRILSIHAPRYLE